MPQFGNNAPTSDKDQVNTLQGIRQICAENGFFGARIATFLLATAVLGACSPGSDAKPASVPTAVATLDCGADGYLSTEFFGALAGKIDWGETDLSCEGMPRPGGVGARLRLSGMVDGEFEIAFIIALPDLVRGETGTELQSKVTVIEEGVGRFFSNGDQETCWTDIVELQVLESSDAQYVIGGSLYCVAPLVEINGSAAITLSDVNFRGLLDWDAS